MLLSKKLERIIKHGRRGKEKSEERRREDKEEEEEKEKKEEEEQLENYSPSLGGGKYPRFSKRIYNLETHFFSPLLLSVRGSISLYIYI